METFRDPHGFQKDYTPARGYWCVWPVYGLWGMFQPNRRRDAGSASATIAPDRRGTPFRLARLPEDAFDNNNKCHQPGNSRAMPVCHYNPSVADTGTGALMRSMWSA